MRPQEYDRIRELLDDLRPERTMEIGMATGGSSVVICDTIRDFGHNSLHTAIDPYQTSADGWNCAGLKAVESAGHLERFRLIEDFDYLALPRLVAEPHRYDFILIDGWHSFDYTLLDIFYADLLLKPGGIIAVHDTGWPAVYRA